MAILLTGGTGKVSTRIAPLLEERSIPYVLASRRAPSSSSSSGNATIKFDWLDSSTFHNPFQHQFPNNETITAIYLVAPETSEPHEPMNTFVDYAIQEHGVKRFVLMGGTSSEPGGQHVGKVWSHLLERGVDYCVLRPTWFMENFIEPSQCHLITLKSESKLYTACSDAKIPFVSAIDIARVVFHALTDATPHNCDHRVLGPELLTYDDVARILSKVLSREVKHVKLSGEERKRKFKEVVPGMPEHIVGFLTWLEEGAKGGMEERMNQVVEELTGRKPMGFEEFARENKGVWE